MKKKKAILEEKLIETYKIKIFNFDDVTLYIKKIKNKIKKYLKQTKDMPILEDLYDILEKGEFTKKFKNKINFIYRRINEIF